MSTEKQYILAFNNGYILEQYEPSLLNIVSQNLTPSNNYLQGLFAGRQHLELEINQDKLYELRQLRSKDIQNQLERE